ncbi:HAD-IA family hydrolase [Nocardioides marinquilinus]|uniref:HAD-IA family hydrolase n=1 Tax=Nocardioides marinquilinus TaxID=1210400 RepID=A0ABP9Q2G6_9ACTN
MSIRAVVLDIGGVLEIIDDAVFPGPFLSRHGHAADALEQVPLRADAGVGGLSEAEVRAAWRDGLGLSEEQADELMADFWRWYVGTLDRPLFAWYAGQRPARLTGILSNSGPGAREAERHHGFEAVTDVLVYSHEVGLAKPDPRVYDLTARRLGVEPSEIVFLDDVEANVEAARAAGWHAVLHVDTPTSIAEAEAVIARQLSAQP